jgi:Na+/glutamate symporter
MDPYYNKYEVRLLLILQVQHCDVNCIFPSWIIHLLDLHCNLQNLVVLQVKTVILCYFLSNHAVIHLISLHDQCLYQLPPSICIVQSQECVQCMFYSYFSCYKLFRIDYWSDMLSYYNYTDWLSQTKFCQPIFLMFHF